MEVTTWMKLKGIILSQRAILKGCALHDYIHIIFSKGQNYSDGDQWVQRLVWEAGGTMQESWEGCSSAMELSCILTCGDYMNLYMC